MKWFEIYKEYSILFAMFYEIHEDNSGKILFNRYLEKDPSFSRIAWIKNIREYNVDSIDPIHIYASFNYWKIPVEIRKERMIFFLNLIKEEVDTLSLIRKIKDNEYLDVFFNFPHLNITNIVASRSIQNQEQIWRLFSYIVQDDKSFDILIEELFNSYKNWHGIQVPSLTIFMFWINSEKYIPLDKNTVSLLKRYKVLKSIPNKYDKYVKLLRNSNDENLFRNLAYMAIDEKKVHTFTSYEQDSINKYLNILEYEYTEIENEKENEKEIESEKVDDTIEHLITDIEEQKEKLIMLDDFSFELFFVIYGVPKVIKFKDSKVQEFEDLDYDKNVIIQPNFLIIGLKTLDNYNATKSQDKFI